MAHLPTLEESERFVLDIYKQSNIRAGEMLPLGVFLAEVTEQKVREEDFNSGMKNLKEKGMIEEKNGKFFLTELGFKAI